MAFETLFNFISGCEFPRKVRRINFYKDGEPLVNKDFVDMVEFVRDADIAEQLWTKTNGALLTPDLNTELARSGLDMIGISLQGLARRDFRNVTGVDVDVAKLVMNIKDLYEKTRGEDCQIYIKLANAGYGEDYINRFCDLFEPISDYVGVEGLHGWSNSGVADFKLGTDNSFEGGQSHNKVVCPISLCAMAINWDGSVSLCNEDWQHVNIVGDVNYEKLTDIWNGKKVRDFWKMHLSGQRANSIACANCDYMCALPDNVDAHRIEMLGRL
jgi:radical SAM protein with 4Fe4S-binding SPASM domain